MSGGSFDYLCDRELLPERFGQLEHMAEELEKLAVNSPAVWSKAAGDTRMIAELLRAAEKVSRVPGLREVWRAIEWWHSGDSGLDDAQEAASAYLREHVAEVAALQAAVTPAGPGSCTSWFLIPTAQPVPVGTPVFLQPAGSRTCTHRGCPPAFCYYRAPELRSPEEAAAYEAAKDAPPVVQAPPGWILDQKSLCPGCNYYDLTFRGPHQAWCTARARARRG